MPSHGVSAPPPRGPVSFPAVTAGLSAAALASCLPGALGIGLLAWNGVPLFTWNLYVAAFGAWAFLLGALDARATLLGRTRWVGFLAVPLFAAYTIARGVTAAFVGTPIGQGTIIVLGVWILVTLAVALGTVVAGIAIVVFARALARSLAKLDAERQKTRAVTWLLATSAASLLLSALTQSVAVGTLVACSSAFVAWRSPWPRTPLRVGTVAVALLGIAAQIGIVRAEFLRLDRTALPVCIDSANNAPELTRRLEALRGVARSAAVPHDEEDPPTLAVYVIGPGGRAFTPAELTAMQGALRGLSCRSAGHDARVLEPRLIAARPVTVDVTARFVPAEHDEGREGSAPEAQRARLETGVRAAFALGAISIVESRGGAPSVTLPFAGALGALEVVYTWKGKPFEEAIRSDLGEGEYPVLGTLAIAAAPAHARPDAATSLRCLQMAAEARALRIGRSAGCERDADCDCAPDLESDCRKGTDRATATTLREMATKRTAEGCPPSACPPAPCMPRCVDHRCE